MTERDVLINYLLPSSDSPESLYKQLSRSLHNAIQQGMLNPGDSLIPERELANKLNLSRITVRKAIDQLVDIGVLQKRHGADGPNRRRRKQAEMASIGRSVAS